MVSDARWRIVDVRDISDGECCDDNYRMCISHGGYRSSAAVVDLFGLGKERLSDVEPC